MRGALKGLMLGGALAATLVTVPAALQPAAADDIHRDRQELRQDHRELRNDQRDLEYLQRREAYDRATGNYHDLAHTQALQRQKEAEIRHDRREIARDRAELRHDWYGAHYYYDGRSPYHRD